MAFPSANTVTSARKKAKRDISPGSVFTDEMSDKSDGDDSGSITSSAFTSPSTSRPASRFSSWSMRSSTDKQDDVSFVVSAEPSHISNQLPEQQLKYENNRSVSPSSKTTVSSARTRPCHIIGAGPPLIRRKTRQQRSFDDIAPVFVPPVPQCDALPKGIDLSHIDPKAINLCKPCAVQLKQDPGVNVVVANKLGVRAHMGLFYEHLFVHSYTPCIFCQMCREYLSVQDFLLHRHHGYFPKVSEPKLMIYVKHLKNTRFTLWQRINKKLARFGMKDLTFELPADLNQLPAVRKRVKAEGEQISRSEQQQKMIEIERAPSPQAVQGDVKVTWTPLANIRPSKRPQGDAMRTLFLRQRINQSRVSDFSLWTIGGSDLAKEALIDKWFGENFM